MLSTQKAKELKIFAKQIQMEVCKMIARLPAGHLGGSLSIADTLAVLYGNQMKYDPQNPDWPKRDWLVMSKGHCGPALYATLAIKGFFPVEMLKTLNIPHTDLPSHCDRNRTRGIDMTTGSLGQGASTAAGVALGLQMDGKDNKVFLILGDGEIQEGQVWEMAMFAASRHLHNLIALVDFNKLQIDGRTDTDAICNVGDIAAKFKAFNWHAEEINGHSVEAIDAAIDRARDNRNYPSVIILHTVKGHGWSKTAGQAGSHSRGLSEQELQEALAEMTAEMKTY